MLAKVCEHKNEMKMNSEALKASPGMVTPYSYSSYGQLEGITHTRAMLLLARNASGIN